MALKIYRQFGWTFLRSTVVPSIFCLSSIAFVLSYVLPSLATTKDASSVTTQMSEVVANLGLGLIVGGPLFLIGIGYTSSVVVRLVSDFLVGNPVNLEAAQKEAIKLTPKLFLINLWELFVSLSGIVISVGMMLIGGWVSSVTPETDAWAGVLVAIGSLGLVAGFAVALGVVGNHALSPAIAVIEGPNTEKMSARATAKRSRSLIKQVPFHGSGWGTVINLYALLALLAGIEFSGIYASAAILGLRGHLETVFAGLPFSGLLLTGADLIPAFFVVWTLIPIWATTMTIVYYDRRIRIEGFDIEALASEISQGGRANRFDA